MAPATFLTALASSLRAARPARRVHVDEGWHADRDLSMAVGRWGWLHVRTLVEEHDARTLPVPRRRPTATERAGPGARRPARGRTGRRDQRRHRPALALGEPRGRASSSPR